MLYLGIDVHRKQLTVNVQNEAGESMVRRQVSTEWKRVRAFFTELARGAAGNGGPYRDQSARKRLESQ